MFEFASAINDKAAPGEGGRPKYRVTAQAQRRVAVLAGAGWPHEDIAIALRITPPTLRKYFGAELSAGALERRAEVFEALYENAVKKGSAAAAKAYLASTPKPAAPPQNTEPETATAEPEGKKAAAQAAAKVAQIGTGWEDLLHPPTTH